MSTVASGASAAIAEALAARRCVILDGGIATQLGHTHGQGDERFPKIEALSSPPADVLDVHRRYVAAGADVITTNTWGLATALGRDAFVGDGRQEPVHWMEVARRGVRLARDAAREQAREADCAVAFSLNGDLDGPEGVETTSLLERALVEDPPDLFLCETLSLVRPSLYKVVGQLVATGVPVWLSFRRCRQGLCGVYGQHWGGPEGDDFGRAARRFEELGIQALLLNCIPPDHVDGMVSYLRDFTDLPLGVYPNLGYLTNAGWRSDTEVDGEAFGEMARRWRGEGADIVGGCCGTGPEHIAAARDALSGTRRGQRRVQVPVPSAAAPATAPRDRSAMAWRNSSRRAVYPLPLPDIVRYDGVPPSVLGSYMTWRYLFDESIGAHQRCLDVGSGTGLLAVQLARNGATHVHAVDIQPAAVANTLTNAFRNGVADRVTAVAADLYPWVPDRRYDVVVATLPKMPTDPASRHLPDRPTDYWGRGLIDQVIAKLPDMLSPGGVALVTVTSLLSHTRTVDLLADGGLRGEVVAWEVVDMPVAYRENRRHIDDVVELSDAHYIRFADQEVLGTYLLEIRAATTAEELGAKPPWAANSCTKSRS